MKITKVEPIFIAVPYEHGGPKQMRPLGPWTHMETLFVRVDTDAGITGWGEAFGFAVSALTREAILHVVEPLCVGREFTDVPSFMADLQRKLHAMGRHGPVSFALAGIDIALWDIAGKAQGRADPSPARRRYARTHSDLREPAALRQTRPRRPIYASRPSRAATARSSCTNTWWRRSRRAERPPGLTSRSWSTPIAPGRRTKHLKWRASSRSTISPGSRSRSIRSTTTIRWRASAARPALPSRPAKTSATPARRARPSNSARSIFFSRV